MSYFEIYLFSNAVLIFAAAVSFLLSVLIKYFVSNVSAEQILHLHYFNLFTAVVSSFVLKISPEEKAIEFPISQKFSSAVTVAKTNLAIVSETPIPIEQASSMDVGFLIKSSVLILILFNLLRVFRGVWRTKKTVTSGFLYKRVGKVSVYLAEKSATPYAFSYFGKSYVSLPISLLGDMKNFMISSKHELQHIRHKDTLFSYIGSILKAVFFFNPAVYCWVKAIDLEQEFSCDESVISKRGINEKDYKNCLYEVAKTGMNCELSLVGATGFFSGSSRSELIRRIQMMSIEKNKMNKTVLAVISAVALSLVSVSAYAFSRHAGFGKLNAREVQRIVDQDSYSQNFKVDVNPEVLRQLNRMTRTSKGKKQTAKILKNFKKFRHLIHTKAQEYGLPEEIAAVAFVESGFTNPGKTRSAGEGMWQFIYPTAEAFDLVVNGKDMRRDVPAATEAAMKYLSSLNLVFDDMRLAILSYNAGEHAVASRIIKAKSRDPWKVTKNGLKYDKGYLAKVMAAAIVMKNPGLVQ